MQRYLFGGHGVLYLLSSFQVYAASIFPVWFYVLEPIVKLSEKLVICIQNGELEMLPTMLNAWTLFSLY